MTRLKKPIPTEIEVIRNHLKDLLDNQGISEIDAGKRVTGRDLLMKIWGIIITVPMGIAIISENVSRTTLANIYYEIGLLQAYGKETLLIKTKKTKVPTNFVGTEFVTYDEEFEEHMDNFFQTLFELPEHYAKMAANLENDPLLSIDYLRRAYLISSDDSYRQKANDVFQTASLKGRAKNSIEMLLMSF